MDNQIKDFIEENIELIENNNWEKIYGKAVTNLISADIGKFTEFMLQADIHPEYYLTELPIDFLSGASCKEFIIPNQITSIGYSAFWNCDNLTTVTIGNGVTYIGSYAFSNCDNLTSVLILDSVTSIGDDAFSYCGDDLIITYRGTKEQWKKIYSQEAFEHTRFTVNCTDGKIVKKRR